MATSVDELMVTPRWYKGSLRGASWNEYKRLGGGFAKALRACFLIKTGLYTPSLNLLFRLPQDFDSQICGEGDVSVDAQLAMKPVIGTLVYECGFRVVEWHRAGRDILSLTMTQGYVAILLHESGLYNASVTFVRNQIPVIQTVVSDPPVPRYKTTDTLHTWLNAELQSGLRIAVTNAMKHIDGVKNSVRIADARLKITDMLPKLQELIAQHAAPGDKPIATPDVAAYRELYNRQRREELRERLQNGRYIPATDAEVASLRAQVYDKESAVA